MLRIALALLAAAVTTSACASNQPATGNTESVTQSYRHESVEEFMLALKACLQARGYDWEFRLEGSGFSITGGSGLDASLEQQERERRDTQACIADVDPARLSPPQLTASQLEDMHRFVVAQTACMRDAGYPVSDPPPLNVYIDTDRAFDPFADLSDRGIPFSQADLELCQMAGDVPEFIQQ